MKRRWIAVMLALCLSLGFVPTRADAQYNDSINVETIFEAAYEFFAGYEGHYDSVTPQDSNSLSIGRLQWHGLRAHALLRKIVAKNPTKMAGLLSTYLYNEIVNQADSTWNNRCLTSGEAAQIKAVISTPEGIQTQDEQAYEDICSYIEISWNKGFRSNATIMYYCSVINQYGTGGANKWLGYVRATMGITANDTISSLEVLHTAVRNTSASTVRNYLRAREKVYNYISGLGWNMNGPDEPVTNYPSSVFTDVPADAWYREAVDFALTHNLFNGTSPTTFSPNEGMTRAMLVTVLYRMNGEPFVDGNSPFTDVKAGSYYTTAVLWAAIHEIVNGVTETQFCPNRVVTHEQAITILYRYHSQYMGNYETPDLSKLSAYADGGKVSTFAKEAMAWGIQSGVVITTTENGKQYLKPKGDSIRAEIAVYLMRYLTANP